MLACYEDSQERLTEDCTRRIITGETGLAHTRAKDVLAMMVGNDAGSRRASRDNDNVGRDRSQGCSSGSNSCDVKEGLPIVNDQRCDLFYRTRCVSDASTMIAIMREMKGRR